MTTTTTTTTTASNPTETQPPTLLEEGEIHDLTTDETLEPAAKRIKIASSTRLFLVIEKSLVGVSETRVVSRLRLVTSSRAEAIRIEEAIRTRFVLNKLFDDEYIKKMLRVHAPIGSQSINEAMRAAQVIKEHEYALPFVATTSLGDAYVNLRWIATKLYNVARVAAHSVKIVAVDDGDTNIKL